MTFYVSSFETAAHGEQDIAVDMTLYSVGDCNRVEALLNENPDVTAVKTRAGSAMKFVVSKSGIPALAGAFKERGLEITGPNKAKCAKPIEALLAYNA